MPARLTALTSLVWLLTESFISCLFSCLVHRPAFRRLEKYGLVEVHCFFVTFGLYSRVELRIHRWSTAYCTVCFLRHRVVASPYFLLVCIDQFLSHWKRLCGGHSYLSASRLFFPLRRACRRWMGACVDILLSELVVHLQNI